MLVRFWFAIAFAAALSGCASQPAKPIADWHDAIVAVRDQSSVTFRGVNDLVRQAQIRRAENLKNLREEDFHPGLTAEAIGSWNRALDALASYASLLSALLAPELASGVGDSAKRLGESIATSAKSDVLQKRPGLASAVQKLGTRLAAMSAARSARAIMNEADPHVTEILAQMARMINDDSGGSDTGILQTVHADWTLRADQVRTEFLRAQSPSEKREVATRYATILEQRSAADGALLGLRRSILELATAHTQAAGGSMDTSALIQRVRDDTAFIKGLLTDLKPATE